LRRQVEIGNRVSHVSGENNPVVRVEQPKHCLKIAGVHLWCPELGWPLV
jgi:hypothetical protein